MIQSSIDSLFNRAILVYLKYYIPHFCLYISAWITYQFRPEWINGSRITAGEWFTSYGLLWYFLSLGLIGKRVRFWCFNSVTNHTRFAVCIVERRTRGQEKQESQQTGGRKLNQIGKSNSCLFSFWMPISHEKLQRVRSIVQTWIRYLTASHVNELILFFLSWEAKFFILTHCTGTFVESFFSQFHFAALKNCWKFSDNDVILQFYSRRGYE